MECRRDRLTGVMVALLIALLMCNSMVHARPRRIWTHSTLWKESDVVCIARLGLTTKKDNDVFFPDELERLDTDLKIELIMKGDESIQELTFVHFQYRPDAKTTLGNGPTFPDFPSQDMAQNVRDAIPVKGKPAYLFFLKRRTNGTYGPTSGDNDADISVARLQSRADPE